MIHTVLKRMFPLGKEYRDKYMSVGDDLALDWETESYLYCYLQTPMKEKIRIK